MTTHYPRLRELIGKVAGVHAPRFLVDDIVQQTLLALYEAVVVRRVEVRDVERWLRATAAYRATSAWRKHVRERSGADADVADYLAGIGDDPSPGDRVAARLLLDEALRPMTRAERTVFVLFYVHRWKVAEIASVLGKQPSTIKTQLARARAKAQRALTEGET